jgi:hypothetical protein
VNETVTSSTDPLSAHSVLMSVEPSGLMVRLSVPEPTAAVQYAFYLFRGDQRVAQTEYLSAPTAVFAMPSITGSYRAVAFTKDRASGKVERRASQAMRLPLAADYDLSRWRLPVHERTANDALTPCDGIYRFIGTGTGSLDFLLQDISRAETATAVLVCFNGAVSKRPEKTGPFFAGTGLGRRLGLPVICVGDPTLQRSRDISLAWYAGCEGQPQLPQEIARRLSEVSAAVGKPLILVGGSGGAYAALSVIRYLSSPATAVACNPQTAIHRYYRHSAARYVERAFPAVARRLRLDLPAHRTSQNVREALAIARIAEDLAAESELGRRHCLLLQNVNDAHHVNEHLAPLLAGVGSGLSGGHVAHLGENFGAWLGHWGEGHVAPPPEILEPVISDLASGASVRSILLGLESRYGIRTQAAGAPDA